MADLTWRNPPDVPESRHALPSYEDEARQLRNYPGEWAIIRSYPLSRASAGRSLSMSIRSGRLQVFRPVGAWESKSVTENVNGRDVVNVYARFTGDDEH